MKCNNNNGNPYLGAELIGANPQNPYGVNPYGVNPLGNPYGVNQQNPYGLNPLGNPYGLNLPLPRNGSSSAGRRHGCHNKRHHRGSQGCNDFAQQLRDSGLLNNPSVVAYLQNQMMNPGRQQDALAIARALMFLQQQQQQQRLPNPNTGVRV